MASDMNMKEIKISSFLNFVRERIEDEDYNPIMGIGPSGIGKTEGIAELCKDMGIGFCELRLVTMTETDLLGVPMIGETDGGEKYTDWASNKLLPIVSRDGDKGILVLDEITSCTSTIRAAAYQLLDSKRALGNYHLPDHWIIVALGNGIEDGGSYSGMEGAFLNRCKAFRVVPDYPSWKKWAIMHNVNPSVIAFLQYKEDMMHKFDPNADVAMFPSPRSWVALSTMLNRREAKHGGTALDRESAELYACAAVGAQAGTMFGDFYQFNGDIISVDDIISGKIDGSNLELKHQAFLIVEQQLVRKISDLFKEHVDKSTFEPDQVALDAMFNVMNYMINITRAEDKILLLRDLNGSIPEFQVILMNGDKVFNTPVGQKFFQEVINKNAVVARIGSR